MNTISRVSGERQFQAASDTVAGSLQLEVLALGQQLSLAPDRDRKSVPTRSLVIRLARLLVQ